MRSEMICREHTLIELRVAVLARPEPGQFLQVRCADNTSRPPRVVDWDTHELPTLTNGCLDDPGPLLRRPISIADHWRADDGDHLSIISRSVGPGTRWLEQTRVGDMLDVTGPLGSGFRVPDMPGAAVLIGGGVGIPPLLFLARHLSDAGWRDVTLILGATTRELLPVEIIGDVASDGVALPCVCLPGHADFGTILATDDGTLGFAGRVTDALEHLLERRGARAARPVVFACGPEAMLRRVAELTRAEQLDCELCIERVMGCGMGTCLSCVVRMRDESVSSGWRWGLACTDGPVFDRDELIDM